MKVLVLSGYGINCENETLHAFKIVGFKGKIVPGMSAKIKVYK